MVVKFSCLLVLEVCAGAWCLVLVRLFVVGCGVGFVVLAVVSGVWCMLGGQLVLGVGFVGLLVA